MRELLKVFKAVADKNRLRILKMLQQKKMCVCELSAVLGITLPSVSKHLSMMKDAGLLTDERNGQWIDYSLCEDKINRYAPVIQSYIKEWVNNDPIVKKDLKKAKYIKREDICKK
jgi:ArsR family transcriptional regulator